jgi:hypothetical protein
VTEGTPWPTDPECIILLRPIGDSVSWLTFIDPAHNVRTSLPITLGMTRPRDREKGFPPVWHAEFDDEAGIVTTTPSILVPGEYHSPYTVVWRIVDDLADRQETS